MARSVLHRNRRIIHPGADVYVDVTGMVQPGVDVERVSAVIGEAPYGEPGVVHVFADADSAKQFFGAGSNLADGIQLLFRPSNDQRVDGGAVLVYAYKPNRTTQAEYWITRDPIAGQFLKSVAAAAKRSGTTAATISFAHGGDTFPEDTFKNLIVEIVSGRGVGQQFQIASSVTTGANHVISLRDDLDWITTPDATSKLVIKFPMNKITADEWGTPGVLNKIEYGIGSKDKTYQLQATYNGRQEASPAVFGGNDEPSLYLKFDPSGGGGQIQYSDSNNWHVATAKDVGPLYTTPVTGVATGSATSLILDGSVPVLTANIHVGRWVIITDVDTTIAAQVPLLGRMYKIKSNDADAITLDGEGLGLPSGTDLTGVTWEVMKLTDVYIQVTGKNGASEAINIYLKDVDVTAHITVPDAAVPSITTLGTIDLTALGTLNDVVDALNDIPGITARLGDGVDGDLTPDRFDFGVFSEHYGLQSLGFGDGITALGSGTMDLLHTDATTFEGGDVFPDRTYPVVIDFGVTGKEEIMIVSGVATDTLTFTTLTTVQHDASALVERIVNGKPVSLDASWVLSSPVGSDTRVYRFGSQLIRGPGDVDASGEPDPGDFIRDNNQNLIDKANEVFGRFTIERATDPGYSSAVAFFGASTPELEVGACQADDMLGIYKALYHGTIGTSVVSKPEDTDPNYPISWEHGFDELLKVEEIRNIVPLASSDFTAWDSGDINTLATMFQSHLLDAEDSNSPRQGYLGLTLPLRASTISGVTYPRGLLEWVKYFNDERMSLVGQTTKLFASDGKEKVLPPWAFACQCAGIQMGTDIGEALTLKFVQTSELGQPFNDWDPLDRLDQRDALLGGLLYGEPSRGRWRIVRGQTTHIATDNLARTDINVWEIRNIISRDLRVKLEDRFGGVGIGTPAQGVRFVAPASIASIREYVGAILEEYRTDGIIIDSQDENGQPIHAWIGLSARISGDIARVKVQVFPKTSLNFILVDVGFNMPTLSS